MCSSPSPRAGRSTTSGRRSTSTRGSSIGTGTPLPEPPDYQLLVRSDVEAGAISALPTDVPAGTYALVCFVDDDLPTEQIYLAEQLAVTE